MQIGKEPESGETIVRFGARCNVCKAPALVTTNDINFIQFKNGECTGLKCPVCNNNGSQK